MEGSKGIPFKQTITARITYTPRRNDRLQKLAIFSKEELRVTETFDEKDLLDEFDFPDRVIKTFIEI